VKFDANELAFRRRCLLELVFQLGVMAQRAVKLAPPPGPISLGWIKKDLRRFRLALCVLGEPIPTWAKKKKKGTE